MQPKELKKILTRISLAGLIATGGVILNGCATTDKAEKEKTHSEEGMTSCSGGEKEGTKTSCSGMTSCGT